VPALRAKLEEAFPDMVGEARHLADLIPDGNLLPPEQERLVNPRFHILTQSSNVWPRGNDADISAGSPRPAVFGPPGSRRYARIAAELSGPNIERSRSTSSHSGPRPRQYARSFDQTWSSARSTTFASTAFSPDGQPRPSADRGQEDTILTSIGGGIILV